MKKIFFTFTIVILFCGCLFTSCISAAILSLLDDTSSSSGYNSGGYSNTSSSTSSASIVSSKTTNFYYSSYSNEPNPNWTCSLYSDCSIALFDSNGILKVEVFCVDFSIASELYYTITGNDMNCSIDTLEACVSKRLTKYDSSYKNGHVCFFIL